MALEMFAPHSMLVNLAMLALAFLVLIFSGKGFFTHAYEAVKNGADYLVVGRPITQHPDPVQAVHAVLEEIRQATED